MQVLKRGSVVETGTHNELIKVKGVYSSLVQRQLYSMEGAEGGALRRYSTATHSRTQSSESISHSRTPSDAPFLLGLPSDDTEDPAKDGVTSDGVTS